MTRRTAMILAVIFAVLLGLTFAEVIEPDSGGGGAPPERTDSRGLDPAPVDGDPGSTPANDGAADGVLPGGSAVDLIITDAEGNDIRQPICMTGGIMWGAAGTFTGLKAGRHDFLAGGVGYEVRIMKDVVFEEGVPTPLAFVLGKEAATQVTFVDPAGRPVAGVRVSTPRGGFDLQAVLARFFRGAAGAMTETGADGTVTIRGVQAGPCRVVAKKGGFAMIDRPLLLPEGGGKLTVTLEPADTDFEK